MITLQFLELSLSDMVVNYLASSDMTEVYYIIVLKDF